MNDRPQSAARLRPVSTASRPPTPAPRPATPPSPGRRSSCSPRSEHQRAGSTEPSRSPRPSVHVEPELPVPQPDGQPPAGAARRPSFLRMPSHDSVGYASIVSVLSWSSLPAGCWQVPGVT